MGSWRGRRRSARPVPTARRVDHTAVAAAARSGRRSLEASPRSRSSTFAVRFGGIVAVDGVSLTVGPDEIVGLIGTNGAGKSTLMNGVGGFVRADGTVRIHGDDVSSARSGAARPRGPRPHVSGRAPVPGAHRAGDGRGRARGPRPYRASSPLRCSCRTRPRRERRRRAEADDLIGFLGLGRYADVRISDLSTGTRRIVELAGLLALDPRVLCLDEPTAGVAQREAEAFGPLIKEIRRELGAAMLVIEHDMPLIMGISDRVYCLEVGRVIAEGITDRRPQRRQGDRQLPRRR